MKKLTIDYVLHHPDFQIMARKKTRLSWVFSILMFVIYVIYIGYIGIDPEAFATPIAPGMTTTWGIYIGLFVILFAILITGIYVHKANGEYEDITQKVLAELTEGEDHE